MLDLGVTEFTLAIPSVPEAELQRLSTSLFDSWVEYVDVALSLPDYSLFLQVDEGSVRGAAKIGALAGALYLGIGNYGDFVSGVTTIGEQIVATGNFLADQAKEQFNCPDAKASSRKRGGAVAGLQRLFVRVQRGDLSAEQAMAQAERMLGEDAAAEPGFMRELALALRECPRYHRQEELPFEPPIVESLPRPVPQGPTVPREPSPRIEMAPPLHLRIEVWRDSKKKRRKTRIVAL